MTLYLNGLFVPHSLFPPTYIPAPPRKASGVVLYPLTLLNPLIPVPCCTTRLGGGAGCKRGTLSSSGLRANRLCDAPADDTLQIVEGEPGSAPAPSLRSRSRPWSDGVGGEPRTESLLFVVVGAVTRKSWLGLWVGRRVGVEEDLRIEGALG